MSGVDYSKFDALAKELDAEEPKKEIHTVTKYYNSDGETVSSSSDDDDDDDEEEDLHPLFWTKRPKPGSKNEPIQKMMDDLIYKNENDEDKTAYELAFDFKEKGNDYFKWGEKFYHQALKEYKKGLEWSRKGEDTPENRLCYAMILSNRAAINLKFQNYGSVIRDCKAAIKYGPDPMPNSRAHFRAASAAYELGKLKEAKEFLEGAKILDPENKAIVSLDAKIKSKLDIANKKRMAKERELMKEQKLDEQFRKACLKFNIRMGWLVHDINQFTSHAVGNLTRGGFPRPGYEADSMQWAVMLMYPEHGQSEYIQSFDLYHTFEQHLSLMFPRTGNGGEEVDFAPWDENRHYYIDSMEVYFEERCVHAFDMNSMWTRQYDRVPEKVDYSKKLLVRVPMDVTLLDALSDEQYVIPGIPTFFIVSRLADYYDDVWAGQLRQGNRILEKS